MKSLGAPGTNSADMALCSGLSGPQLSSSHTHMLLVSCSWRSPPFFPSSQVSDNCSLSSSRWPWCWEWRSTWMWSLWGCWSLLKTKRIKDGRIFFLCLEGTYPNGKLAEAISASYFLLGAVWHTSTDKYFTFFDHFCGFGLIFQLPARVGVMVELVPCHEAYNLVTQTLGRCNFDKWRPVSGRKEDKYGSVIKFTHTSVHPQVVYTCYTRKISLKYSKETEMSRAVIK